ncbi:hypothetical protein Hanom_Chr04g00351291 [Helianthus anomalus]
MSWVLTSEAKRIDDEMEVVWGNGQFKVWVAEVENKSLDFIIDDLSSCGGGGEPPEESIESVVGKDEEIEDEVEDGEIRSQEVEGGAEIPVPEDGNPAMVAAGQEDGGPVGEGEGVHGKVVENEELHGGKSQFPKTKETLNASQSPIRMDHAKEPT